MKVFYGAIGFCKETIEQRMKTFLSQQVQQTETRLVNEFKLTVIHLVHPNRCRSAHVHKFITGQKNCKKSGLGHWVSGPSRAMGRWATMGHGHWAVVGLLLAKHPGTYFLKYFCAIILCEWNFFTILYTISSFLLTTHAMHLTGFFWCERKNL